MTMPEPPDERSQQLLDAVYAWFSRDGRWPSFAELDRYLDSRGEPAADEVIRNMPNGLLYGAGPQSFPYRSDQEIGLTVAGLHACADSGEDERIFLDAVRLAARLEAEWQPDPERNDEGPTLDATAIEASVRLPAAGRDALLQRVGKLLATEHWGWSSRGEHEGVWRYTVSRYVRKMRGVQDVADYWLRSHPPESANELTSIEMLPSQPPTQVTGSLETPSFEAVLAYLHPVIRTVSEPRLRDGYGDNAVEEACKVFAQRLRELSGLMLDGVALVNQVLGTKGLLELADRSTDSGRNEQDGYAELLRGLFRVGRNVRAHRPSPPVHDELEVIRLLLLASLCLSRLDTGVTT